jgi:hypothetical protein
VGRHLTRWLIPLPAIFFTFWPTIARADTQPGLNAVGYAVTSIPPTRADNIYTVCHSETENNINRNYNYEPFGSCPNDWFMVHYTGFIEIPANNTIRFMVAADDGGTVKIGLTEFGTWNDKGCSWSAQTTESFSAGTYPLDGWFYENGGGTCFILAWNINNTGWQIVPDSAYTTNGAPTTTTSTTTTTSSTTTTTTTTTPTTSTTVEESTTTSSTSSSTTSSTTDLPTTTTTTTEPVQTTTTTSTTSTTTTTTTTVAPSPTTTEAPYTPPQTTTTSEPAATTTSSTTTTTSLPESETTVEETSTTTYLPDPDTTVPQSSSTLLVETAPQTSQPQQETDIPQTTQPEEESSSTTTIPLTETPIDKFVAELDIKEDEPITDEKVEQILEVLADAAPAQIVAAIEQVLATNITSDQAVSIASSPEVLAAVTEQQAEAIFEQIVVEELTEEVAEQLVEVLNEAPTKVKKAFQETINVFAGVFDSFQMVGQTIPVGERRTLVAVSNTLVAVGASLRRKND